MRLSIIVPNLDNNANLLIIPPIGHQTKYIPSYLLATIQAKIGDQNTRFTNKKYVN